MEVLSFSSDPAVKARFLSPRRDSFGWLASYALELEAMDFRAATRVDNPGYGHPPSQLFDDLAKNWTGWSGEKSWRSMEGEVEMTATCDRAGHVTLTVVIAAVVGQSEWSAQVAVMIEAGQLHRLAADAESFFAERDV